MAECIHYGEIVRYEGRRGIVGKHWHQYPPRPGVHLILGFAEDGGGTAWAKAEDVEKLPTVFLGMPNEYNLPEPGQPLTLLQQIPHNFDSYLWSDMSWEAQCAYCGLPKTNPIHPEDDNW